MSGNISRGKRKRWMMAVDLDAARQLATEIFSLRKRLEGVGLYSSADAMDDVEIICASEVEAAIDKVNAEKKGRGEALR